MPATATDRLAGLTTSVAVKPPCAAVTAFDIPLTGLFTINGVALQDGDRVLVIAQTDRTGNGIYNASTSDWTRALDFDGARDVVTGTLVLVRNGATDGVLYEVVTEGYIDIGSTEISFKLHDDPLIVYGQTQAEINAGIIPANRVYQPGVIDRYGFNTNPGLTDMSAAFAASLAQQQAGGLPVQLLAKTYLVSSNAIKTQSNQKPVVIFGVPFTSCIVNKAPANTPTIQLIDQFTFEISGIVFAGRAGFPNTAIDLNSAQGGQRCGFGKIRDCVLMPNGIGIHYAGGNDLVIDSCKYWPNGAGGLPGSATHDGANALPGGIVSDTKGIAGWNPGEVNAVYIRDFQAGQCNGVSATPSGAGILVDGSLNGSSTAPLAGHASTDWVIDGYDSGGCERALYMRFCQFFTVRNLYTSLITLDNDCTGILFESIFGDQIVVDSTKTLGGCDRLTYINCVGLIIADSGNSLATHINCDWFGGDGDLSSGKRIVGGRVAGGARVADSIGASGLCLGPVGAIQLAGSSGAGGTISAQGSTVIRLNPAGNCTGIIFNKPPLDGFTSKVINISAFTVTMAAAGTSFVADGVACVIPALREMDFTYDSTSGLWYHT